jgi:predicted outer membrane repeat protein
MMRPLHDRQPRTNSLSESLRPTTRRPWRERRPKSHRPRLEVLEPRVVLSPTIFTVDSTGSGTSGSGMSGTLPYVNSQANSNSNTDGSEIEFDSSVFSSSSPQTITPGATLVLSETAGPEVIDGPGAGLVTISGNNTSEVFDIAGDNVVSMSGLSIIDGNGTFGGGLFNEGTLTITNTAFTGNSAPYGGAIYTRALVGHPLDGFLTLTGDTFSSNSATAESGAIDNWAGGLLDALGRGVQVRAAGCRSSRLKAYPQRPLMP